MRFKREKHDNVCIEALDHGFVVSYRAKNDQDNWEYFKRYCDNLVEVYGVVCEFYNFDVEL